MNDEMIQQRARIGEFKHTLGITHIFVVHNSLMIWLRGDCDINDMNPIK
jgi:hypothetical protein